MKVSPNEDWLVECKYPSNLTNRLCCFEFVEGADGWSAD